MNYIAAPVTPSPKRWAPRSRLTRILAVLLVLVASPCATELALGSVAAAFSESAVVTDSCCPNRAKQAPATTSDDEPDRQSSPDDARSACGCCHAFNPPIATALVFTSQPLAAPPVADTSAGKTDDGHTEPPFRPPAR